MSTWLAVRQRFPTSPPVTMATFDPAVMEGHELIYLCLHGLEGQGYLYGDGYLTAISTDQIRAANLGGAIVYNAGCWGVGPVSDALLRSGAAAVVADMDVNWAGWTWWGPSGSNLLGRLFVGELHRGATAELALSRAKLQYANRRSGHPLDKALLRTVKLLGDPEAVLGG